MSQPKRSYIARKYWTPDVDPPDIVDEGIFESYESAYKYIEEINEGEDGYGWYSEIVSYIINDKEPEKNEQKWTFDRKVKLVQFYDAQKGFENAQGGFENYVGGDGVFEIVPKPTSYTGLFEIGDIVAVRAFPWNLWGPFPEDILGVIAEKPVLYDEWLKKGNSKSDWYNEYAIEFIRNDYLTHIHVEESGLKKFEKEIPEKFSFLIRLSEHYKSKNPIKDEILTDVFLQKIFVEKVRYFDENESVVT